ncbi:hypothetical protein [Streptomyces litchfieldiae]|uniref:Uncharacterized protein n=1 Tax=Streptomyces litchfieldiae TaxID=3075543 RepID=A0ABU2N1I5_9ACTN|nr:hypothetical protein [Streptomyces sp. DSM 44938]MDT0347766.1 hypothetical protein [Streptomyces sp. DSM 44938]
MSRAVSQAVAQYAAAPELAALLGDVVEVRGAGPETSVASLRHTYGRRVARLPAESPLRPQVAALLETLDELDAATVRLVSVTGATGASTLVLLDREVTRVLFWSPMWVSAE